jgi:hypothetical protein
MKRSRVLDCAGYYFPTPEKAMRCIKTVGFVLAVLHSSVPCSVRQAMLHESEDIS